MNTAKYINTKKTFKSFFVILGLLGLASCDDYFDINNNPNQISVPTPELTLTSAQIDLANFMQADYNTAAAFWVRYYTQAGNVAGFDPRDQYNIQPGDNAYQNDFTGIYSGPLQDLEITIENAQNINDLNTVAVAQILKAYAFQNLVDMFDKVPYFDALNINEEVRPKYDDGSVIYDDLLDKLDEAIENINPQASVNGDIIFQGNMRLWIKFANSLKLKIYMRQSEARPEIAESGVASLATAEFLEIGEDAEVKFDQTNPSNRHPDGVNNIAVQSFTAASATSINALLNTNDPRIDIFWRKPVDAADDNPDRDHKGVDQGRGNEIAGSQAGLSYYSARGNFLIGATAAHPFFSAAEIYFLLAEASERGWYPGDAEELFTMGVRASFARTGASGVDAYLTNEAPYPTAAPFEEKLEAIMYQKWVALTGRQSIEMWAEWRRTGYPDRDIIDISPISILPAGEFPLRFPVTQREINLNVNAPSPSPIHTPVWWDVD